MDVSKLFDQAKVCISDAIFSLILYSRELGKHIGIILLSYCLSFEKPLSD